MFLIQKGKFSVWQLLTLRVILVASEMVVCSIHCHSKCAPWDCTGGGYLEINWNHFFNEKGWAAQLTKHAYRENCVGIDTSHKVIWIFLKINIHSKPLQESSILSVMGKQCNGDHGAKCQYLISDTLMLHIMMSI